MGKNILIVEDEAIPALNLKLILERSGFNVCASVMNGVDAVSSALSLRPDLILMDIFLADSVNGIEAVRRIQETSDIPVLYLSASTDQATMARAASTKHLGFIGKPFNDSEILERIHGILDL